MRRASTDSRHPAARPATATSASRRFIAPIVARCYTSPTPPAEEERTHALTRRQRAADSGRSWHADGNDDAPLLDPGPPRVGIAGARLPPGSGQAARRGARRLPRHAGPHRVDRRVLPAPAHLALLRPQRGV